jgi:alkylation response protein AidB-like acyl-CoA dehydrogenase
MTTYELTQDHCSLRDAARKFAHDVLHPASMETEKAGRDFPADILKQMGELGFLGLDIPPEHGGQGFDTLTCGVILEEISATWFSAASYCMTLSTGPILFAGSDEQKKSILPLLCSGKIVTAFALTEPDGGSDAAAIKTFARKDGDDYVINGTKIFITNAHRADVLVVFVRTDAAAKRGHGISILLVDKGTKGLVIGERYRTLGHQANGISEIVFDNCRVPRANLVGEEGKGFAYIQRGFATKIRAVYGARCVGVAQGAMDYALQYANERRQFGQSIASFQGNRFKVADILSKIEAARHLSYRACVLADQETEEAAVAASMAKHFASNVCMEATSEAIQLMGGHGFIADHPLERYYREAKLFQIGDGTSEVLRLLISRYANACAQARQPARLT